MTHKMYLRFYGQTEEKIKECIDQLRKLATGLIKVTKNPLTKSINMFVPTSNNIEVWFHFDTKENLHNFYKNNKVLALYNKYSTPIKQHKVVRRDIGDTAWG